jgi:hypothetical protein
LDAIPSDTPKYPRWSPDGEELCYNPSVGGGLTCRRITTEPFEWGTPVLVPPGLRSNPPGSRTNYDITKDERVVGFVTAGMNEYVGTKPSTEIQVVLNWFTELEAKTGR